MLCCWVDILVAQRNQHLRTALSQMNAMIWYRMLSRQSITGFAIDPQHPFYWQQKQQHLRFEQVATLCPAASMSSLHLPLCQHGSQKCLRLLRFVEQESECLQSKERSPFLVTVECIEKDFRCDADDLFSEGRARGGRDAAPPDTDDEDGKTDGEIPRMSDQSVTDGLKLFARDPDEEPILVDEDPEDSIGCSSKTAPPPFSLQTDAASTSASKSSMGVHTVFRRPLRARSTHSPPNSADTTSKSRPISLSRQSSQLHSPLQSLAVHVPDTAKSSPLSFGTNTVHEPSFLRAPTISERLMSLRAVSPFAQLTGWTVKSFIVKSGDDLKKEILAIQLLRFCQNCFAQLDSEIYLKPYEIFSLSTQVTIDSWLLLYSALFIYCSSDFYQFVNL
jgi:hypothetical protein